MLMLGRKVGERIMIGNDIIISISAVKGDFVRVGVEAPKEIQVHREEIYKKIQEDKNESK